VVAITGPRQAGKTFRLYQLVLELLEAGVPRSNILYVNFEHERLRRLDANDLEDLMKVYYEMFEPSSSHPVYLLLDEIQLVRDWDKWVRRIHDTGKFRVYVTGSTSKLSSREVADALRGRSVDFPVFPFSFREFLKARGFSVGDAETLSYLDERGRVLRLLEEYLTFGGFPRVVLAEGVEEKRALLKAHYEAIFYRDLVDRCKLDPELLDLVLSTLVSSAAGQFSASKLLNVAKSLGFKCSKATLIRYVECARQAYLPAPLRDPLALDQEQEAVPQEGVRGGQRHRRGRQPGGRGEPREADGERGRYRARQEGLRPALLEGVRKARGGRGGLRDRRRRESQAAHPGHLRSREAGREGERAQSARQSVRGAGRPRGAGHHVGLPGRGRARAASG
jgi:hypothetical protein